MDDKGWQGVTTIRTFIVWFMLITLPIQSDTSLERAEKLLKDFDKFKDVFSDVYGCSDEFPKLHGLAHYIPRIRTWGPPDNYDIEYTEHQHIADAKQPYRRTNKINPLRQMVKHVEHRTALEMKYIYLDSIAGTSPMPASVTPIHKRCLGSCIPNCPMYISDASRIFQCKNLKLCIRSFLHDCQFPSNEGRRHRIKIRNLPQLDDDSQVKLRSCK